MGIMMLRGMLRLFGNIAFRIFFIVIIIWLGLYFNRLFDALLLIVIILQFELVYMQYWNERSRHIPIFRATLNVSQGDLYTIKLYNMSTEPAYSVSVCRVLCKGKPLDPVRWREFIKDEITPCLFNSEKSVHVIKINSVFFETTFTPELCALEVCYETKFGDLESFYLFFYGSTPMVIMHQFKQPEGFLTAIPRYIGMLIISRRLKVSAKKLQRKRSQEQTH